MGGGRSGGGGEVVGVIQIMMTYFVSDFPYSNLYNSGSI